MMDMLRYLLPVLVIGLAGGVLITVLNRSGAPDHWAIGVFWSTVLLLVIVGLVIRRSKPGISWLLLLPALVLGVSLVYLFPEQLSPGCNGMPNAFAANGCKAECVIPGQCTDWQEAPCSLCSADDAANKKCKGCCYSYGPET